MKDDELEIDASNVYCVADAFMAIFGLHRSDGITNEITKEIPNEITETMEPLASEEQDEGYES